MIFKKFIQGSFTMITLFNTGLVAMTCLLVQGSFAITHLFRLLIQGSFAKTHLLIQGSFAKTHLLIQGSFAITHLFHKVTLTYL